LRAEGNDTPALILSALGQVDDRVKGLRACGDDYLAKPYAFSELLARVEVLSRRRGGRAEETVYKVGDLELDRLSHRVSRGGEEIVLQPREFRLLEYLMKHAGQVVTRTLELGLRGRIANANWHGGFFRAGNDDDILFVMSEQTGFGYFRNFGETRRQGIEMGVDAQVGRMSFGAGYTFLDATFQSEETVNGESNSANDAALEGEPGTEGAIEIEPGDRMPFTPRHMLKLFAGVQITKDFTVDVDVSAISSSYARGNENNLHEPDGTYYLGQGTSPGYAVVNLGARYRLTRWLQLLGQINNVFDRRYYTGAQLGPLGFSDSGDFIARPLPAVDGQFPVRHSTFYAPGAPIRAWIGTRFTF